MYLKIHNCNYPTQYGVKETKRMVGHRPRDGGYALQPQRLQAFPLESIFQSIRKKKHNKSFNKVLAYFRSRILSKYLRCVWDILEYPDMIPG